MELRKLILGATMVVAAAMTASAGVPPTIMILPDKQWCNENGYVTRSERNGKTRVSENYDEAFLNGDLKNVVTQLNGLFQDNGLPVKSYFESNESDDEEEAEEELFEGGETGESLQETPYEQALNKLKPDIIVKIGWNVSRVGFDNNVNFRVEAIDSYTGKSVGSATASPTAKITVPLASVLQNTMTEQMDQFKGRLQSYFDNVQANGREITVTCRIIGGGDVNFNSEFGGQTLSEIITNFVDDNTVNHAFNQRNATRNRLQFDQVRIPFTDSAGRRMQARQFVDQLKKYLSTNFSIASENTTKGLGGGRLYIGEK